MKLDIIVPHYKEPFEVCKYLLDSIAMQRRILFENVRVIMVNDGDYCVFTDSLFSEYPFAVDYVVKEHGGVSAARNFGLDRSNADYVMFCDCDDGFLSNYALHMVFSAMQEGFDYLYSNFIEETFDEKGNPTIINHDADLTFMHGKCYRRQFLVDNGLRFDPSMTIHEDGYFNMLCYVTAMRDGKLRYIQTPFYVWCWNDNSVVRSNRKDFVLKTYKNVMQTRAGICKELKRRGYKEDYVDAVCMTVLNSYYDFQKTAWRTTQNKKRFEEAEKEFRGFWMKFKNTFNNCTNQKISEVARVARETALKNGFLFEQNSLKSFLRHIEYEVK